MSRKGEATDPSVEDSNLEGKQRETVERQKSFSRCSKHLIVHGGVSTSGSLRSIGRGSCHGIGVTLTSRPVVGHLGVKLLDGLLLGALATGATTTTTGLSTSSTSTRVLGGSGRSLCCSCGLGLVLLRLSMQC